jgi:hypothetical protein
MPRRTRSGSIVGVAAVLLAGVIATSFAYTRHGSPRLVFERTRWDAHTVSEGTQVKARFAFQNRGTRELVVEDVSGQCACTASVVSDDRIPPAGRGAIDVSLDTSLPVPLDRKFVRSVTVRSNDPALPAVQLEMSVTVLPEFRLSHEILDFDSNNPEREVIVERRGGSDARIIDARANPHDFQVSWTMPSRTGQKAVVTVRRNPDAPPSDTVSVLTLKTTSALKPEIRIPLRTVRW